MKNLQAEMKRNGIENADLQRVLGCSEKTARNKKKGKTAFTVEEAIKIRDAFFPGMRIGYLFAHDTKDGA